MAKLIYFNNTSLDGYFADETGAFDWGNVEEVHEFITDLIRPFRTYLYGRRLFETMSYWDAPVESYPLAQRAFAEVWQKEEKIVYSRALSGVSTRNTRLEREFHAEAIQKLKRESESDIGIGGAELAGVAMEAELVDECHLFLHPIILGKGKPAFGAKGRRSLELLETRRFSTGVVGIHARIVHRQ